jgi:outer membrane lipoprotein-sorting protein
MRVARKCAAVLAALSLAVPVWAQFGGPRMPGMSGIYHPVVGQGAAYEMQGREQGMKDFEVAVVGKEDFQGQTGYWLETSFQEPRGGAMVMKMLMVMEGPNPGAKRMIMLMNGQAYEFPMNSPMMGGQMAKSAPHDIRNDKSIVKVGTETITVPAGTFSCEHYRASDGSSDVWVSDKISPWGLVKSVSKDSTMVLSRQITDAKTKITGPVKPFDPMQMMQQQQRP